MRLRELSSSRRSLLFGCLLAVTLHAFDELSVLTALPLIVAELEGRALYGAVFFAYVLASVLGLVGGGWLADRYGPARPFSVGLSLFFAGLAAAVVAPSMTWLVCSRALQGLGGGVISTVVLFVVNRGFSEAERPRVMALNSAAWVLPALMAPAAAGLIAERWGWRWVFAGLMPLVLVAAALALPAMRRMSPGRREGSGWARMADGGRLAAGVGMVLAGLGRPLGPAAVSLVVAGALIAARPLGRILPAFGAARVGSGLGGALTLKLILVFAFFGTEAFVPLALRELHGQSAALAGLVLTTAALAWTSGSFLHSRFAAGWRASALATTGAVFLLGGVGLVWLLARPGAPGWLGFAAWASAGLGMGLGYNSSTVTAMAHTADGEEGSTSTALGVADALGVSLSTGIGGAIVGFGDRSGWSTGESLGWVWGTMAAVAGVGVIAALGLGTAPRVERLEAGAASD